MTHLPDFHSAATLVRCLSNPTQECDDASDSTSGDEVKGAVNCDTEYLSKEAWAHILSRYSELNVDLTHKSRCTDEDNQQALPQNDQAAADDADSDVEPHGLDREMSRRNAVLFRRLFQRWQRAIK